jgi:hypothetical protein
MSDPTARRPRANTPTLRHRSLSIIANPIYWESRSATPLVTGLAKDEHTPISAVSYSVDGGPWRLLDAVDGIYDSRAETFRFALPPIKRRGTHTLDIQAKDGAGNIGIRQIRFVR